MTRFYHSGPCLRLVVYALLAAAQPWGSLCQCCYALLAIDALGALLRR